MVQNFLYLCNSLFLKQGSQLAPDLYFHLNLLINFLHLNKRKSVLGHPIASTRANKFSLAAEPGTEFYDPVSATGEPNKGCRKKANKYRMKCLYGGETMDQTTNTRRL